MPLVNYTQDAIARARQAALEWLESGEDGCPRSWDQESENDVRRGYVLYDEFEAPPIVGYEALEREGIAVRIGLVPERGRVRFRLAARAHG